MYHKYGTLLSILLGRIPSPALFKSPAQVSRPMPMRILIVRSAVTDYDRPLRLPRAITSPLTPSEATVDDALHALRDISFGVLASLEQAAANILAVLPLIRHVHEIVRTTYHIRDVVHADSDY